MMKISVVAALVGCITSSVAFAGTSASLEKWTAFSDRTPKGTPLCALTSAPTAGQTVKNISVKKLGGDDHLNITMYKDSWKIPQGTSVITIIDFADGQPLTLESYGDGKVVDVALPKEVTAVFLSLLIDSKVIRISFPKGKEPTWEASLASIRPQLKVFVECMRKQENTQPF